MSKKFLTTLLVFAFATTLIIAGCGDDAKNPAGSGGTADPTALSLIDIGDVIRDVAPPVFTAPTSAPGLAPAADSFLIWTSGDYPLLDKVFGNDDPQTLYRNIDDFEMYMGIVDQILLVEENGDLVLGTFIDTQTVVVGDQSMEMYATAVVTELTAATGIPIAQQGVLGTSYDLDYLVSITVEQIPGGFLEIGLKIDSTEQTMLVYQTNMSGQEGHTESSVVYASLDPTDSTFVFKGVMYSNDGVGTFSNVFSMTSESTGDFAYRMSWFSDEIPAPNYTLLGCIIGGGNKDSEFALGYRQYTPADDQTIDAEWNFDEVFGPDYTNGTGLISSYSTYVDEALIFGYSVVPQANVTSPYAD